MREPRATNIDAIRAVSLMLMAFGHFDILANVNIVGHEGFNGNYPDPVEPISFFIRVIRHPCAVAFFFVSGMVLFKGHARGRITSKTLVIKALILLAIGLTLNSYFWRGGAYLPLLIQVLSTFGLSFLVMALLIRLPPATIAPLALLAMVAREVIHVPAPSSALADAVYRLSWEAGGLDWVTSIYPLIGWLPVMLLGFGFEHATRGKLGALLSRRGAPVVLGLLVLGLFATIRATSTFGSLGQSLPHDAISFFMLSKYPPSIHFILFGLGFTLIGLGLFEFGAPAILVRLGRYGLGFYLCHMALYRLLKIFEFERGDYWTTLLYFPLFLVAASVATLAYGQLKDRYRKRLPALRYL